MFLPNFYKVKINAVFISCLSQPDFHMASLQDNGMCKMPKLVGDFKKLIKRRSFVYWQQMMHNSQDFLPIFGMPATLDVFWLYLCIPEINACIAIAEDVKVQNVEDLAKFFSAMKYGVTKLMPLTMFGNKCFSFLPTENVKLLDAFNTSKCVFHCSGVVYKLYDTLSTPFQPNEGIIKQLDKEYLPGLCVTPLKAIQIYQRNKRASYIQFWMYSKYYTRRK